MQPFACSQHGKKDWPHLGHRARRIGKAALLACAAACCAPLAVAGFSVDKKGGVAAAPGPPDARAMVEALANRNPVPVISGPDYKPIFAKNYDSSECMRAASALDSLIDHAEDAWPEMVAHLGDGRYSITFRAGSTSGYCHNWTVGDVCREIIVASLTEGYLGRLHQKDKVSYYRLRAFVGDKKDLKAWCEARRAKPLYELQFDVCQWALADLARGGFQRVPTSRQAEWAAGVKSEAERLKVSKKAFRFEGFGESVLVCYGNARR